jgi:hypothetical protein
MKNFGSWIITKKSITEMKALHQTIEMKLTLMRSPRIAVKPNKKTEI